MSWKKYWLLVALVFVITQPGSIAFANWDAPYGFYKDLSVWLGSSAGGLLLVLTYGLYEWGRKKLGPANLLLSAVVLVLTVVVGYSAELAIGGEMGYGSGNIVLFVIGGFLGFILSVMLLLISLPYVPTGDFYYPYDRPLVIAWLVLIVVAALLGASYVMERRKEKLREPEGRVP
ncbi:hypothetical protein CL1_0115 [Thermococcus cleftensis]|uniref:Uncharacterized protein n=2 Tax=Thermococcus cleftensis (strain DSM 27260 / KACC 17922 / CL1) TaxID=163003 RepID=I3ZRJ6_THECF|nr:hypothetical protein CL1_0115 [Thermococcus cleftensis]